MYSWTPIPPPLRKIFQGECIDHVRELESRFSFCLVSRLGVERYTCQLFPRFYPGSAGIFEDDTIISEKKSEEGPKKPEVFRRRPKSYDCV